MPEINARQKRFVARRRNAAVERALKYLSDGSAGCPDARMGTAEKQVRESPRPLMVAKALVKDWCQHDCPTSVEHFFERSQLFLVERTSMGLNLCL